MNGIELTTAEVGGSEGLRRLRELRADGYLIQQRRHPDPERDVWQYRLVDQPDVSPLRVVDEPPESDVPSQYDHPKQAKMVFGVNKVCRYCEGTKLFMKEKCRVCDGRGWV